MIIEIKDMPQGRKIKHINVNITFDDGIETTISESSTEDTEELNAEDELLKRIGKEEGDKMIENIVKTNEKFTEAREDKPIPEEMKDTIF